MNCVSAAGNSCSKPTSERIFCVTHRMRGGASVRGAVAALLCGTLAACSGSGAGLDANGRPVVEATPTPPPVGVATFQQIQDTILTPVCTQCHAGAAAPLGLRLDAANSFSMLVNVPSVQVPSLRRVAPGDPDASYLVQKIEGRAGVGARMPLGGPPLPQASLDLVREWIATGAMPAATSLAAPSFAVTATVPAHGERADAPLDELRVVFNAALDVSRVGRDTFSVLASGGDERFDDGNEREVALHAIEVSLAHPNVVALRSAAPLSPDRYRLGVRGSGASAVADVDARVLDGDFMIEFDVQGGAAQ